MLEPLGMPERDAIELSLAAEDGEKLADIFRFAAPTLLRIAKSSLGSSRMTDVEDVVQETYTSFIHYAARGKLKSLGDCRISDIERDEVYRHWGACRKFLASIVKCKCVDCHRQMKSQLRIASQRTDAIREQLSDATAEQMQQEQSRKVWQAVMGLSKGFRDVVTLYYHGDYSQEEIAAILNISVRMVKYRLRAALAELRSKLSKDMTDDT
jgi:RNA polymerase sigma factor (sigma-70 family)